MRVYHGTVEAFLPAIQSEGLKYTPDHSFKMDGLFGSLKIEHGVYVSTDHKGAEMMAYIKAIYLARKKGADVPGTSPFDWKTGDLVVKTKPVVLTLDVPESISSNLQLDREWGDDKTGFFYRGTIPASLIQKVEVLENHDAA